MQISANNLTPLRYSKKLGIQVLFGVEYHLYNSTGEIIDSALRNSAFTIRALMCNIVL